MFVLHPSLFISTLVHLLRFCWFLLLNGKVDRHEMDNNRDIMMLLAMRDSILHTFFQILWEKARSRRTLGGVRIPDTVVFSHSRVADWYFTSKDGSIRKKGHLKLSSANVLEQFEKRAKKNKSSVVGVLLERDVGREDGLKTRHMDLASVRQFLGEGGGSGTLQSFVEPKVESGAVHNNEIVLNWTPNVFYVEKKKNLCDIAKESKGSLDERTTVEETAKNVNVAPLVSSRVTAELEAVCQEIALHVEAISKPSVRLASIGLHAKVDANDQLWVLFCSSFRIISVEQPSRVMSVSLMGRSEKNGQSSQQQQQSKASANTAAKSNSESPRRGGFGVATGGGIKPVTSFARQHSNRQSESPDLSAVKQTSSGYDSYFDASSSDGESLVGEGSRRSIQRGSSRSLLPRSKHSHPSPIPRRASQRQQHNTSSRERDDDDEHEQHAVDDDDSGDGTPCCVVCINPTPQEDARVVPRRHVIFPLSIISFFSSHSAGTRYVDVVGSSKQQSVVPEFIQLTDPDMTLEEFNAVRRDDEWLSEPLLLCDECAEGLRDVVSSLKLERDGSILVPRTQKALPTSQATTARSNSKPPRVSPARKVHLPPRSSSSAH